MNELLAKPPLGPYPLFLWREQYPEPTEQQREVRRRHVQAAIDRRMGTQFPIPAEWLEEVRS